MANHLTVDDAMAAVFDEFGLEPIRDDEFTQTMYAERHGIPMTTAGRHLDNAYRAGKLTKRRAVTGRNRPWVYRLAERNETADTTS